MNRIKIYFTCFFFLIITKSLFADKYPRDYSIAIKNYSFYLTLSDQSDEITGKTAITVLFKKDGTNNLILDLVNKTDERKGKGMIVDSVKMDDTNVIFTHTNDKLNITFSQLTKAGQKAIFSVFYHGFPIDGLKIGSTKFGDRSFFSENWPNKARHWLPTIDHPYYKATSEFIITAPAHYKVISNGLLMEESNLDASRKLTHWKQSIPVSCWLFVLGVAEFAVKYDDNFDGKSIQSWVYPQNRESGFYDFSEVTKSTVHFFSDYIGPYQYEKIANIQTPSVSGGMETSSAIFYAENLITGKRDIRIRNVIIHELAHQWFGNAVTESTWDDAWLSEGFATFFTLLYIENKYGHEEYVKGLINAKKTVYDLASKDPSFSIVDDRSAESGQVTSGITYQKGAWVLHMLRNMMGDKNFKRGIRSYYSHFMNSNATTKDFKIEMEKACGMNLDIFFNQWLFHPENPSLKGNWTYDKNKKQVKIHLEQTQNGNLIFDLPVEIGIYMKGNDLPKIVKLKMNSKVITQSIILKENPEKITIDPRTVLLAKAEFEEMNIK